MEDNNLISLDEIKTRNEKLLKLKNYKRYLQSLADLNQLHEEASFLMRDMSLTVGEYQAKMEMILDQMIQDKSLSPEVRLFLKNQKLEIPPSSLPPRLNL